MSRVGKALIKIPSEVSVKVEGNKVNISGKSGSFIEEFPSVLDVVNENGNIKVSCKKNDRRSRSLWGLYRALINNMVEGIAKGYKTDLEINGVGYKASTDGKNLFLSLGYSHDIIMSIPTGLKVVCEKPTSISISGISKADVGQFAAQIRKLRAPEPYKGKGIKYIDEKILRKVGKKK